MTAPIKFMLSPQGTSNSLKFAHEHLLNQFFMDQVVTGLNATGFFCQPVYGTIASDRAGSRGGVCGGGGGRPSMQAGTTGAI